MALLWYVLGVCVVYDLVKSLVYIGSKRLTAYLQQKKVQAFEKAIQKHLEKED